MPWCSVTSSIVLDTRTTSYALLTVALVFEGALLFAAAKHRLPGGPAVLANMAVDRWAPTSSFPLVTARHA